MKLVCREILVQGSGSWFCFWFRVLVLVQGFLFWFRVLAQGFWFRVLVQGFWFRVLFLAQGSGSSSWFWFWLRASGSGSGLLVPVFRALSLSIQWRASWSGQKETSGDEREILSVQLDACQMSHIREEEAELPQQTVLILSSNEGLTMALF